MKRDYKKQPLFNPRKAGQFAFTLFIVFIAYKILTPPSDELVRIDSPDGTRSARLRRVSYYDNQPSFKVDCRDAGKIVWLNLFHLPAYTNSPVESAQADLAWSPDSGRIDFLMNGTSIWHHAFDDE
jgi:hypothetical protein